jgi:hypothetical protein
MSNEYLSNEAFVERLESEATVKALAGVKQPYWHAALHVDKLIPEASPLQIALAKNYGTLGVEPVANALDAWERVFQPAEPDERTYMQVPYDSLYYRGDVIGGFGSGGIHAYGNWGSSNGRSFGNFSYRISVSKLDEMQPLRTLPEVAACLNEKQFNQSEQLAEHFTCLRFIGYGALELAEAISDFQPDKPQFIKARDRCLVNISTSLLNLIYGQRNLQPRNGLYDFIDNRTLATAHAFEFTEDDFTSAAQGDIDPMQAIVYNSHYRILEPLVQSVLEGAAGIQAYIDSTS